MVFRSTHRALLTETLPYEVPVVFSNERLYASSVRGPVSQGARHIVSRMREQLHSYTIPYAYTIRKDAYRTTSLSVIHPNYQTVIADFYDRYHQSIISYCSRSPAALRKPIEVVDVYSASKLSKGGTLKLGIPHIEPQSGETEAGHISSYFSYGRYNLLGRFIDSREFRELEKQFRYLRTIDITKCFHHIYTHSVTWAAKGKDYAKQQAEVYSFEGRLDRLMQEANYNETNGIVIGPEISRIFAEIILQDVDVNVIDALKPLRFGIDYEIRRYVDDYFIFSNSNEIVDRAQLALEQCLERYKLFLNNDKTESSQRPFVTNITLARSDIARILTGLHESLNDLKDSDVRDATRKAREVIRHCSEIRLVCERFNVSLGSVSGWLMSQLRVLLRRVLKSMRVTTGESSRDVLEDIASAIIEVAFYICSLDLRVRSTYSICHMLSSVARMKGANLEPRAVRLVHFAEVELAQLISTAHRLDEPDAVELYNLLIAGAFFIGSRFLQNRQVAEVLEQLMSAAPLTYFRYVALKFCLLRDPVGNAAQLMRLNGMVAAKLSDRAADIGRDSQTYLLACDFLSAPDVEVKDKRATLDKLIGGQDSYSNADIMVAGRHLAFVDWQGLRIHHLLARKELRPVYAWA